MITSLLYEILKALIDSSIWTDPAVESLDCKAKLILFWLLTNPSRDNAGVTRCGHRRLSFETGIGEEEIEEHLSNAMKAGRFEKHGDRVVSLNWIAKQIGKGDCLIRNNIYKQIERLMENYPRSLQSSLRRRYPELIKQTEEETEAPCKPLSRGIEGGRKGKERKGKVGEGKEEERTAAHTIESFCDAVAQLYGTKLQKITPEAKRTVFNQCPTEDEMQSVLKFIKRHRAGNLGKDAPAISTTANRALINISDMIDRALAVVQLSKDDKKETRAKIMPDIERDPPTEEEIKEAKEMFAELKTKIKKRK